MNTTKKIEEIICSLKSIKDNVPLLVYKPDHFLIEELVDPQTYKDRGNLAIELFDPLMLWTLDRLREKYGKIIINNWIWGGQYKYSGFRPKSCIIGSFYSQHRLAKGFDLKFEDYTPEQMRQTIKQDPDNDVFKFITCVENNTPTWLHIDGRHTNKRIKWINP